MLTVSLISELVKLILVREIGLVSEAKLTIYIFIKNYKCPTAIRAASEAEKKASQGRLRAPFIDISLYVVVSVWARRADGVNRVSSGRKIQLEASLKVTIRVGTIPESQCYPCSRTSPT